MSCSNNLPVSPFKDMSIEFNLVDSFVDSSNYKVQGVTHDLFVSIGELLDMYLNKDETEETKQNQHQLIQYQYRKSLEVLSQARKMLRYEEFRIRHAYKGYDKIRNHKLRFHNPIWKQYYEQYLLDKVETQPKLCLDCGEITKNELLCDKCIIN